MLYTGKNAHNSKPGPTKRMTQLLPLISPVHEIGDPLVAWDILNDAPDDLSERVMEN
jgi:hypothetical protein